MLIAHNEKKSLVGNSVIIFSFNIRGARNNASTRGKVVQFLCSSTVLEDKSLKLSIDRCLSLVEISSTRKVMLHGLVLGKKFLKLLRNLHKSTSNGSNIVIQLLPALYLN